MNLKLQYRIGAYDGRPDGIYPVVVDADNNDEIVSIFKYPAGPRNPGTMEGLKVELVLYNRAAELPVFDRGAFGVWSYCNINGWDDWGEPLSDEELAIQLRRIEVNLTTDEAAFL